MMKQQLSLSNARKHAVELKRALFDKELMYIYRDRTGSKKKEEK